MSGMADQGASNSGRKVISRNRQPSHPFDHEVKHFKRGGVGPMRVLEQNQQRLPRGQALHPVEKRRKSKATLLRGRDGQRGIALADGIESIEAISGTIPFMRSVVRPSTFSSLSSLASGGSCGAIPAARSNCCANGWSALSR